jgi:hypothetical protein
MTAFSTLSDVFANGLGKKTAGGVLSTLSNLSEEYQTFFEGVRKGELSEEGALKGIYSKLQQNLQQKKTLIDIQRQVISDANALEKSLNIKQMEEGISKKDSADLAVALEKKRLAEQLLSQYSAQSSVLEKMLDTQEKGSREFDDINDKEKERLRLQREQEKILIEKLKLENELSENQLRREIELLQLREKIEQDPVKKLALQEQIYYKEAEFLKLKYDNEIRVINEVYKNDQNILLKREKAYQDYVNNLNKIGDNFIIQQFKFQEDASKGLAKAVEDATK